MIGFCGLVITAIAVVVGISSCGMKVTEPFRDADRSRITNSEPADVVEMPDGFNNLSTKCDHGNRVYVTYHGDAPYGAIAVVPGDPSCKR